MVFKGNTKKPRKVLLLVAGIVGMTFIVTGGISAVILMKVVPQKIGYKDVQITSLSKKACEECHPGSMVDTHHSTKNALSGKCVSCHKVSRAKGRVGIKLDRNCMVCHVKSPHHRSKAAMDKECTSCHDSPGVGAYTTRQPSYKPSKLTPTTDSCKNCHRAGIIGGIKVVSIKDAHHGISLKGCDTCHDSKNKRSKNIRICERCHNAKAIHEVAPHVADKNCIGCHGDKLMAKKSDPKKKKK